MSPECPKENAMPYAHLDKETARSILQCCCQSTLSLGDIIRIAETRLSRDDNRLLRRALAEIFVAINDDLVVPIHRMYPDLIPTEV